MGSPASPVTPPGRRKGAGPEFPSLPGPDSLAALAAELAEVAKERDEWQELAVRLAEEAGVDAEQMIAQARAAEDKP